MVNKHLSTRKLNDPRNTLLNIVDLIDVDRTLLTRAIFPRRRVLHIYLSTAAATLSSMNFVGFVVVIFFHFIDHLLLALYVDHFPFSTLLFETELIWISCMVEMEWIKTGKPVITHPLNVLWFEFNFRFQLFSSIIHI